MQETTPSYPQSARPIAAHAAAQAAQQRSDALVQADAARKGRGILGAPVGKRADALARCEVARQARELWRARASVRGE